MSRGKLGVYKKTSQQEGIASQGSLGTESETARTPTL